MRLIIDNSKFQNLSDALSLIGRSRDCQVRIVDSKVSRIQCSLIRRYQNNTEYYQIVDGLLDGQPSSNGTFLNGQRLGSVPVNLRHGDKISFSQTEIVYEVTSTIKFSDKDETLPQAMAKSI